ncbi:MAG: efflux RND transporter permease subunit, partial [Sphingomicrobium sp.]
MTFRNISSWCIQNTVPPIVLFVGLMLAGIITFMGMQVNNNPDIDFPAAVVAVSQPGAAPAEMESQVTQRVESAIRGVSGVDEINSTVREGVSETFVQFEIGTPTDRAINDVRNAMAQIRSNLPDGILEPQVVRVDIAGDPIVYAGASTTDMSLEELSWYVDNTVARRLLGVEGVAAVERTGGVDRRIRIILDPTALQAQGVTAAQVNSQLRQSNLNAPGGQAEFAGSKQSVRVLGNAKNAYDLSQTQISLPGGRYVRLADLGQVKDSYAEQTTRAKMNGAQVVSFEVTRAKGSSEVTAYDSAWAELHKIEKDNPKIKFNEIFNEVEYTKAQYTSAMEGLIEGAILAVLVVLLFLRDIRATLISALAIPLSAIPAFWFMDLLGISLNFMSTMAMSLVAGVLVDDAIVEIENIVRHMRMGKSAYQASLDAADEIGLAVLATTMAIVAVFLPVALMPGISGQFFKAFGFTVVVSVLMSLLVARMITPLVAAYFLRSHGVQPHANFKWMDAYLNILNWSLDTTKADAAIARLPSARGRWTYYLGFFGLVLVMIVGGGVALVAAMKVLGMVIPKSVAVLPALLVAIAAGYLLGMAIAKGLRRLGGGFGTWFGVAADHWNARLKDNRMLMVGAGLLAFVLSIGLFGTLSMTFQPPLNRNFAAI